MADWAELTDLYERFGALGTTRRTLTRAIDTVAAAIEAVKAETAGDAASEPLEPCGLWTQ